MSAIENPNKISFSTAQFCVFVFLVPLFLTLICVLLVVNTLPNLTILSEFWVKPYIICRYFIVNAIPLYYLFGLLYLLLQRPIASTLFASFLACAIVFISNLKFTYLKQPLIASDFFLFNQIAKTPNLYFQYLRLPLSLVSVTTGIFLVLALVSSFLERPFPQRLAFRVIMAITGCILIYTSPSLFLKNNSLFGRYYDRIKMTFYEWSPYESVRESGLFFSLKRQASHLFYVVPIDMFVNESAIKPYIDNYLTTHAGSSSHGEDNLPDIIVVLNESFFDLRELKAATESPVYKRWDSLRMQSIRGFLRVETRVGNTPKTEFSFLTGIPFEFIHGSEYPYYSVVRRPMHSLPSYLRSLGYTTIAVHPDQKTFWNRNIAYPFLGFDKFFDLADFTNPVYIGWYVSDESVTRFLINTLENETKPVFIFAITIENHGPWYKDRGAITVGLKPGINPSDLAKISLTQYMFHLSHGVDMVEQLREYLKHRQRRSVFVIYGDHSPGFIYLFDELKKKTIFSDDALDRTPFMLWRSWATIERATNIHISYLPSLILETAGLVGDRFFAANGVMRQVCGESVQHMDGIDEAVWKAYRSMAFRTLLGMSDK